MHRKLPDGVRTNRVVAEVAQCPIIITRGEMRTKCDNILQNVATCGRKPAARTLSLSQSLALSLSIYIYIYTCIYIYIYIHIFTHTYSYYMVHTCRTCRGQALAAAEWHQWRGWLHGPNMILLLLLIIIIILIMTLILIHIISYLYHYYPYCCCYYYYYYYDISAERHQRRGWLHDTTARDVHSCALL